MIFFTEIERFEDSSEKSCACHEMTMELKCFEIVFRGFQDRWI